MASCYGYDRVQEPNKFRLECAGPIGVRKLHKMSQFAPDCLRVPPGFEHLLEGLAREVLREQPSDIITFAANYFREKLILRDGKALGALFVVQTL